MIPVGEYIMHFTEIWKKSSCSFPGFEKRYPPAEQAVRENKFEEFQKKLKQFQSQKERKEIKAAPEKHFFPAFGDFLETVFDYPKEQLEIILSESFRNVSRDFFYRARKFDPDLPPEKIYQGLRNVWIMNGVQLMMNLPVEITPSVFAYSMIYPYSDNFLDDPGFGKNLKDRFSKRFNSRLHGEKLKPETDTEKQIFRLVAMIEEQYRRDEFPGVYESLYAIQKGQTDSLQLLKHAGLTGEEVCRICFEKGGASVLADGYLVAGRLSPVQEQALFGYGVYLQLLDDIQDVKEDSCAFTRTMFSCLKKEELSAFVNKTIHFGRTVMEELRCFEHPAPDAFLSLMNRSIEMMIIESVGLNNSWYSTGYLGKLNVYSPLGFEFIRLKKGQAKSQRFAAFRKFFENASQSF